MYKNWSLTSEQRKRVEDNIRLVWHVMHRYYPGLVSDEDAFQEGCIGLCNAAARFKLENGVAFSTFAVPCIRTRVSKYLKRKYRDQCESLDVESPADDSIADPVTFIEMLPSNTDIENQVLSGITIKAGMAKLDKTQKKIMSCKLGGMKVPEICKKIGRSRSGVFHRLKQAKDTIDEKEG
ncbi:RNA polymerase sigma factor (sigma-70 family) [Hydrogenispora ethanolica]|uniref:RNA polymerase sigma factor (Sigma-70 family) n=1 Tax=Hydrogenispora ethanolica TaxID=1082276 RepID=A0A4R1RIE8_HYDET|nr:sigma-70 family RNA polymerase sigma factor [Hydrogenispora ethanolica]TCL65875.1 RNA polymerase sigma factor (sigma-70 family) [Hydrogenispora ethanolica]